MRCCIRMNDYLRILQMAQNRKPQVMDCGDISRYNWILNKETTHPQIKYPITEKKEETSIHYPILKFNKYSTKEFGEGALNKNYRNYPHKKEEEEKFPFREEQQHREKKIIRGAHLRRFFFRRLRRRGLLLVSPLCKGVARFPCGFRAVAATLAPLSPSPSPLPCTGGLLVVRAPALASVVAASSLHHAPPALRPCCCFLSRPWSRQTACKQSPSRRATTATNRNDSTPSTKHVSSLETYTAALRGGTSMRVQSPSPRDEPVRHHRSQYPRIRTVPSSLNLVSHRNTGI